MRRGTPEWLECLARHKRLRRRRGKATQFLCWGCCGNQAREWAQKHGTTGLDFQKDYMPLCRSCHIRYDADARPWTPQRRADRSAQVRQRFAEGTWTRSNPGPRKHDPRTGRFLSGAAAVVALAASMLVLAAAPSNAATMGHRRLDAWYYARHHQGCPYQWAQDGPCWAGYDCSGFAKASYRHAGVWLPHSTYAMLSSGRLVRISHARSKVGDLAFYGSGHVEVVAGRHYTIGAQQPGTRTGYHRWSWASWWHPTGFYRLRY